jgi:uncharacterized protein (DUF885 family)
MGLVAALALPAASAVPSRAFAQPPAAAATAEDARLQTFLDAEFERELDFTPQMATVIGRKDHADKLNDLSDAGLLAFLQWRRGSVARLKKQFDRARLGPEGQTNYDMWALELARAELAYKYRRHDPPFYSYLNSPHAELPNFLINTHVVDTPADMRGYVARLRALGPAMDQAIARGTASAQAGVRMPRFQYERVVAGSRSIITGAPFDEAGKDSPLWADAKAKVGRLQSAGKIDAAEAQGLLEEARQALLQSARPAYQRVIAWAEGDMAKAPSGRVGALTLPDGAAYYASALKRITTTDLTAEQIHQLGLKEVARIEAEQDRLARSAGFADRQAFYANQDRTDPPTPYDDRSRAEVLATSNANIARARSLLPKLFGQLPAYAVEVVREPAFSEVAGGAAHAAGPSPDGSRPGRVYLHMAGNTPNRAGLASLMCHEGIPGHVMQGDIGVRQTGGPNFRKISFRYVAYGEGWGLYAEALCKEMGAYTDVAEDFMRLDAELFRAARLVTDTGIHAKGWTEEQAVKYLIETGRRPPQQAASEARRYITNPGQATAYKIGMIRIQEARARAEKALGPKFDVRAFHDLVIGGGSLPLSVLDRRVDDWIRARQAG